MTKLHDWMWTRAFELLSEAEQKSQQFFSVSGSSWQAPVDVFVTSSELVVRIAMPGVAAEDIQITLDQNILQVSGHCPLQVEPPGAAISRLEIPYGRFTRTLELPGNTFNIIERVDKLGCITLRLRDG